jgi:hypothetical protein
LAGRESDRKRERERERERERNRERERERVAFPHPVGNSVCSQRYRGFSVLTFVFFCLFEREREIDR